MYYGFFLLIWQSLPSSLLSNLISLSVCYIFPSLFIFMLGLDVIRTDRTLVFYEKQENLSKLWDILAVYAWFDKEVSYCQGELL